jgi:hypothetical protein
MKTRLLLITDVLKYTLFPFRWLFDMPPVDQRPQLRGFIRYLIYMDYDRRLNETYIYYKTFILNSWINGFFMSMYYISFVWKRDIDLFL